MKTTILGGVLFLAPVAVLIVLFGKVFEVSKRVAEPLNSMMPFDRFAGVAVLDLLAVCLILLFCYVTGLLAKYALPGKTMQKVDGFLVDIFPGYAVFKGVLGSHSGDVEAMSRLKPVLARFDDQEMIAFETERSDTHCVVYLPGTPSAWSGTTVILERTRVTYLDIPAHQAVKLMRAFGRGTLQHRSDP